MNPLSGVIGEAWSLYRRYAAHFLAISFVITLVAAVVEFALTAAAGVGGLSVGTVIRYLALFMVQAALVKAVQDVRNGRVDLDFGQTLTAALPSILPIAIAWLLAAIGIAIGLAVVVVPGLVLLTFWSLIVPTIVVGGSGPIAAFGRSWHTVKGYAWHVFGTYVLVFLIWIGVSLVLGLALLAVPILARDFIVSIVADTLLLPFLALIVTLMYFRLTEAHGEQPEPVRSGAGPGLAHPA